MLYTPSLTQLLPPVSPLPSFLPPPLLLPSLPPHLSSPRQHSRLQPLLAVGPDVGSLARLLGHGAGLARRCVRHTCTGPLAGRAARPAVDGSAARAELEAGSLLLARGGVCLLGDLSKYRREALHALQKGERGREERVRG